MTNILGHGTPQRHLSQEMISRNEVSPQSKAFETESPHSQSSGALQSGLNRRISLNRKQHT